MSPLVQHVRIALRQLGKTPGFTVTVVLTLALGIGATTAIFSLVEGVLLRPLPFSRPGQLVTIGDRLRSSSNLPVTAREIGIYSSATSAFSSMGGFAQASYELSGGPTPEQINAARLTATVLPTLGVAPVIGRAFTAQEEESHAPVAVISYSLWSERYQRDPRVVGALINLDRKAYTIIGVMPREFEFPLQAGRLNQVQVWVPMGLSAEELSDGQAGFFGYQIVARLKPGVTLAQAASDADRVAQLVMQSYPPTMTAIKIRGEVTPLREQFVSDVRPMLRTLFIAVAVVLLIVCANVAGLLLVRAIRRRREFAIRLALGARSGVIIRESVLESLLLSIGGGGVGLAFATIAIRFAVHLLPDSMPRIEAISMNPLVATFAVAIALLCGVICGLAPAFAALRTDLSESLKQGDRTSAGSASHTWLRSALVVSEIAIALVLLTVSGAFLRSIQKMRAVDPGFQPDRVLVAGYQLPLNQYPTNAAADNLQREIIRRLREKPGVVAAGTTNSLPASQAVAQSTFTIEGQPADTWKLKFALFAITSGDYFRAMQIPLVEGRYFTENDSADQPLVVIVNQTMAHHAWPGQNPIGKRMHVGNPNKGFPWATVVGVVADTRLGSRDEPADDQWYMPSQQPEILGGNTDRILTNAVSGFITLRSSLAPEQMEEVMRATVREVDPLLALQQIQPMKDVIANVEAPRRFNTDLITAFAVGALLLAITGIYAVVAFSVSLRTHEIAIRMALGAKQKDVLQLVLASGTKLAFLGCALGVFASLATARIVTSFLFEVSATDPHIYVISIVLMLLMALLASLLPGLRAASTDPVDALRSS